jgi:DNA-directed RNA polymerase delta subunit
MPKANNADQNYSPTEELSFSFKEALNQAISGMADRSRDIIFARYGVLGKAKTLEEIGNSNKITRERVRQIIQETFKKVRVRENNPSVAQAKSKIAFTISQKNGIIDKEELIRLAGKENIQEASAARFFLDCFKDFTAREIKGELKKSYMFTGFDVDEWRKFKNAAHNILESEKRILTHDELAIRMAHRLGSEIKEDMILNWLTVSEEIKKNNFGKWGLSGWEEVTPKNTREKAYLVLKEAGKPLHFTEITELIDKYGLNRKKTHPQTVHNELIKDERFVLVGRGTYAMADWGYKKGTVKEIIEEILRKKAKPIGRDEILNEILKVRKVKKSTVMINLNNSFMRVGKSEYTIGK